MENIVAMDSYFTGLAGESAVQSILSEWKIASTKIKESDFGEDLLCDVFISTDKGRSVRTNLTFRIQVKTTQNFSKTYIRKTQNSLSFPVETSLLKSWLEAYYPVVLVIWNQEQKTGYWCIPSNELSTTDIHNEKTKTIHFHNDFLTSEMKIKEYIQQYYNGLYKAKDAAYRCKIYPIWMPKYRLLPPYEVHTIFNKLLAQSKFEIHYELPDLLPSYMTSYNSIDLKGILSCLEYTVGKISLNDYLNDMFSLLSEIKSDNCEEWMSLIVSPIELICEKSRPINQLTGWQAFSILNGTVVSDFQFAYELFSEFIPTQPVRASSDNKSIYIHTSGDFSVQVLAAGFAVRSRLSYENRVKDMQNRSFCIWDTSECTANEKEVLTQWCMDNHYQISNVDVNNSIIIISHPFFFFSKYESLFPSASTWREFDELDFKSQDFISKIPYGKLSKSEIPIPEKFNGHINTTEVLLQNSDYISGEVINHADRLIHFVAYIKPIDKASIKDKIKDFSSLLQHELAYVCNEFNLFVDDDYSDNMADLVMDIKPKYNISTISIIKIATPYYIEIFKAIIEFCSNQANMAYYIKYQLDRNLPERLVKYPNKKKRN